ncbi:MAG: HmuY family protein [Polyangiaceae bacterium]
MTSDRIQPISSFRSSVLAWPLVALLGTVACSSSSKDADAADASTTDSSATADAAATDDGGTHTGDAATSDAHPGDGSAVSCTAALKSLLGPVDSVSTGAVTVLATDGTAKTIYVDAAAGGINKAPTSPRLYLSLETLTRVDVTDVTATSSTAWDLALKRNVIFTNGGMAGTGQGASAYLPLQAFGSVTSASATGKEFSTEAFVDPDCNPYQDRIGGPLTSFGDWYDYEEGTNLVRPKDGTFLVKGATGKLFKVRILNYYSTADGGTGTLGAFYTLQVAPL